MASMNQTWGKYYSLLFRVVISFIKYKETFRDITQIINFLLNTKTNQS